MTEDQEQLSFGPFDPQELDKLCQALQGIGVGFEISKDDSVEERFKSNDGQNVLSQTTLRTGGFTGQMFYLNISALDLPKAKDMFERYGVATSRAEFLEELDGVTDFSESPLVAPEKKSSSVLNLVIAVLILGGFILFVKMNR